jgi:hypothetical protein
MFGSVAIGIALMLYGNRETTEAAWSEREQLLKLRDYAH